MNLLVANDDGVGERGVWVLARELRRLGRVALYAPTRNYSGAGMSITLRREVQLFPAPPPPGVDVGIPAFALDAPPASLAMWVTARFPNTTVSRRELLARRFAPCTPVAATSPQAYNPATVVRAHSSVETPPIR